MLWSEEIFTLETNKETAIFVFKKITVFYITRRRRRSFCHAKYSVTLFDPVSYRQSLWSRFTWDIVLSDQCREKKIIRSSVIKRPLDPRSAPLLVIQEQMRTAIKLRSSLHHATANEKLWSIHAKNLKLVNNTKIPRPIERLSGNFILTRAERIMSR